MTETTTAAEADVPSLLAAANLALNALHECIVPKGAELQISDAMRALRSAIDANLTSAARPLLAAEHKGWKDRDLVAAMLAAAPQPPVAERDYPESPMKKVAQALREKAAAEREAFDRRIQSGEWGLEPEPETEADSWVLPEPVSDVWTTFRGERCLTPAGDDYYTSVQVRAAYEAGLAAPTTAQPAPAAQGDAPTDAEVLAAAREISPALFDTLRAQLAEAQRDAERLDWIIEHRAYVVSDPDCCDGYWLNYTRPDGTVWTQATEHETPRAAIDAAKGAPS